MTVDCEGEISVQNCFCEVGDRQKMPHPSEGCGLKPL